MFLALLPVLLFPVPGDLTPDPSDSPGAPIRTERVTLHSRGALVEASFAARAETAGSLDLQLGPFPAAARQDSFRVRVLEGDARVADVELHLARGAFLDPRERQRLEEELDRVRTERMDLDADYAGLAAGDALLDALVQGLGQGQGALLGAGEAAGAAGLEAMFSFVQKRRAMLSRQRLELDRKATALDSRIAELEARLEGSDRSSHLEMHLRLDVRTPGPIRGEVVYLLEKAGWTPGYELRVAPDLSGITVALVAEVRQEGGLDWEEVELLMSTARPELGLAPPPLPLRVYDLPRAAGRRALGELGYAAAPEERERKAGEPAATVEDLGMTALFRLAGRRTVRGDGRAHRFVLQELPLEVQAERYVVPSRSSRGFLRATVRHTGDAPLLPGRARVFLGPDYLGESSFPALRPGDVTTLSLGVDPNLTVRMETVKDERDEPGWLGSTVRLTRVYRATLRLSAAAPGPVDVLVEETIPVSRNSDVEVTPSQVQPLPLRDEESLRLQAEQGLYRWRFTLAPGQEQNLRWGWVVSFDEAEEPVLRELPRPVGDR